MGLILGSAWNVAGELTGFDCEPVHSQQLRSNSTPTALSGTLRDCHIYTEGTGEEDRPLKLLVHVAHG